jgi:hypothetical protein
MHTVHRAVIASVEAQLGPLAELVSVAMPWFSATFEGVRHELHFAAVDPARLAALQVDDALVLLCPDHIIVSVGTEQAAGRASVHLLTICCD